MSDRIEETDDSTLEPAQRAVIVQYSFDVPVSPANPSGHLAGETYIVGSGKLAQQFHPEATILYFQDTGEPFTVKDEKAVTKAVKEEGPAVAVDEEGQPLVQAELDDMPKASKGKGK